MTTEDLPMSDIDPDLKGETAVVTGGTKGIGRAVARQLAQAGATTIATYYRDEEAAKETENELEKYSTPTDICRFDVGDSTAVKEAFRDIRNTHDVPTLLVNNAGIMRNDILIRMDDEDWGSVLNTNLTGAFNCMRAAVRGMLRTDGGAIVNVSSIAGKRGWPGQVNYAASKAGLLGLTRSAAREFGERDIRINAVCPGYAETEMYDRLVDDADYPDLDQIPQGEIADAEEIASAIVFLLTNAASYINGSVLRIDGGRLS